MTPSSSQPWRIHLALLAVACSFGMHYYWGKVVVQALPDPRWPLAWAAIRVNAVALLMGAVAAALGRWRVPAADLPKLAGLACFGVLFNQVLFIVGLKHTTPTQSALINTVIPVVTLALACLMGQERMGWRKALGIVLALSGAGILLLPRAFAAGEAPHWMGNSLTFSNALSFSLFLVLSRPLMKRTDAVAATAWLFAFGAVGMDLMVLPALGSVPLGSVSAKVWKFGAAIVVVGTTVPYLLNAWALRRAPASTVAAYVYVQPLIAAATSVAWLGERLTWRPAAAATLIFAGVALGTWRAKRGIGAPSG